MTLALFRLRWQTLSLSLKLLNDHQGLSQIKT
jgi:hypothetical protein